MTLSGIPPEPLRTQLHTPLERCLVCTLASLLSQLIILRLLCFSLWCRRDSNHVARSFSWTCSTMGRIKSSTWATTPYCCGRCRIRTYGTSRYAGFQDQCIRPLCQSSCFCTPDRIRTYDRLLRRQMLYPAELRAHTFIVVEAGIEPARTLQSTRF